MPKTGLESKEKIQLYVKTTIITKKKNQTLQCLQNVKYDLQCSAEVNPFFTLQNHNRDVAYSGGMRFTTNKYKPGSDAVPTSKHNRIHVCITSVDPPDLGCPLPRVSDKKLQSKWT